MKNEQIKTIENKSKKTKTMNNEQIKSIEFYKNNGVKIITYRNELLQTRWFIKKNRTSTR